jgi:hypothetical protein
MLSSMSTCTSWSRARGAGALVAGLALLVAGCGSPGGPQPGGASSTTAPEPTEDPGPPPPTTAAVPDPSLELEVRLTPRQGVEALALDMVSVTVSIRCEDPADLDIPGPPALRLEVTPDGGGDPLATRPHPLRPKAPKAFPLSLEAGERLELGPMDLGTFDLDPLGIVGGKPYVVLARYRPGPDAKVREVRRQLVLAPATADFPFDNPKTEPVRPAVPLKVYGTDGALRVEYLWSPDTGLEMAEEPEETPERDEDSP